MMCIYAYKYTHTKHTHKHIYIYIYIYIYLNTCVCTYICEYIHIIIHTRKVINEHMLEEFKATCSLTQEDSFHISVLCRYLIQECWIRRKNKWDFHDFGTYFHWKLLDNFGCDEWYHQIVELDKKKEWMRSS